MLYMCSTNWQQREAGANAYKLVTYFVDRWHITRSVITVNGSFIKQFDVFHSTVWSLLVFESIWLSKSSC
jgi:hypothetical protein